MKRSIIYIFICLLSVLLMSHNVLAFSISQNVDIIQTRNQPQVSFYNGSSWSSYQRGTIRFNYSSGNFTEMRLTKDDFTAVNQFSLGDYIVLKGFFAVNKATLTDTQNPTVIGGFIGSNPQYSNCSIIDLQFGAVQEYDQVTGSSGELWYRADFQLTCKIVSYAVNNNLTINLRVRPDIFNVSGANTRLNISFDSAVLATPSNTTEKEEAATQEAANNSQSSGNSSQTNSQNATSNLLSVFTGFASVITNASATNCVINAPLNTTFGNDRLNVDLCSLSLPPALGALTSIIAVMVIVPFAISMFNKFVAIMESFQR